MPSREWDGSTYDRISATMEALGREVLDRLTLNGDELVIDAGCGSGRITQALLERLPRGRVIALDESASMIEAARRRLGTSVELHVVDLLELELGERADAVLSTATFHWISDHARLFERLHGVLRPGGQLVAQCGGRGNIDVLRARVRTVCEREPFRVHFTGWQTPWNYAGPRETEELLRRAGFSAARCWLTPAPREPDEPREFLQTIVLGPHVQRLPEHLREQFMDQVMAELGEPVVVDYIRLNIDATA